MVNIRKGIVLFTLLLAFSQLFSQEVVESIVAVIDSTAITYSEIIQEGELLNIENNIDPKTPIGISLKSKILDLLLFRYALIQEAKRKGIAVKESLVTQKVDQYNKNVYIPAFKEKYSIDKRAFRIVILQRLLADKVLNSYLDEKLKGKKEDKEARKNLSEELKKKLLSRHRILMYSIP